VLNNPVALCGLLLTYMEKVIALESEVAEMRPQVQALERVSPGS
jgi:anti-repressor protein